jgi:PAS domain S-box-containing protein
VKKPRDQPTLRARLAEADETIRAIRDGEVDAIMGTAKRGPQVFTLGGANHPYRVLIESMNEGALTLTRDKTILYANQCFARMVKCPLEQVTGGSFRRFLSTADRAALRSLLEHVAKSGSTMQASLQAADRTSLPVQISVRVIAQDRPGHVTIAMVVTDMTEARHTEEMLRALTRRVVDVQEVERGRVALELHDNISQLLVAVQFHSQALADSLTARDRPAKKAALKLRELVGQTVAEVQRIAQNLRPSILDQLGPVAMLRATCTEFAKRTHIALRFSGVERTSRLPAESELALYRILQEALNNVEQHAHARHVTVRLVEVGAIVLLAIGDDGIGFDPERLPTHPKANAGLGVLSMQERARYVGGAFALKSGPGAGTVIEVRLPLPSPQVKRR